MALTTLPMKSTRVLAFVLLALANLGALGSFFVQVNLMRRESTQLATLAETVSSVRRGTVYQIAMELPSDISTRVLATQGFSSMSALQTGVDADRVRRAQMGRETAEAFNSVTVHIALLVLCCLNFLTASVGALALLRRPPTSIPPAAVSTNALSKTRN